MGAHATLHFLRRRSNRCLCRYRTTQNSTRVKPEIKMANIKPEVLEPLIADQISGKFRQLYPYFRDPAIQWG